jgi:hypothetical protein
MYLVVICSYRNCASELLLYRDYNRYESGEGRGTSGEWRGKACSRESRETRKYILIIETFRAIGVICGKKQPAGRK